MASFKSVSTGPAIEGCNDAWEEMALALCLCARKQAVELKQVLDLQESIADLRRVIEEAEADLERAQQEYSERSGMLSTMPVVRWQDPVLVAGIVLGSLAALVVWFSMYVGIGLISVAAIAAVVGLARQYAMRRAAQRSALAAEAEVGRVSDIVNSAKDRRSQAKAQLASLNPRKSVRAVGRVYFPAEVVTMNGQSVAVDTSGTLPSQRFRVADFSFSSSELQGIVAQIDTLRNPPVLLAPEESASGKLDELHGEEKKLRDTVEAFAAFVGRIPTTHVDVPAISNTSAVARELAAGARSEDTFPGAILRNSARSRVVEAVSRLNSALGTSRSRGVGPKIELLRAHTAIADLLELYRSLRTTSMSSIHQQFLDAMSRSSWCSFRYYCPKTTRNPDWILARLGVDIATAHEADQVQLLQRLTSDPDIAARVDESRELIPALGRAWTGLTNVKEDLSRLRAASAAAASTVGAAATASDATLGGSLRHLQDQLEQYVHEYRICLNRIIFGQRQPLVEFSSQPVLHLEPDTGVWHCEVAGTEYHDVAEIECSRVLRLHSDLLHPMWMHLWTEKADFRRSEMFRTNEQSLRMSEKESEKLIAIGNQFRDDMRTTRDVLKQVSSELQGKVEQLRGTREALVSLGLLSAQGATALGEDAIGTLDGVGPDVIKRAEEKETLLALEPQAQLERRTLAVDPIDIIADPTHLFSESMQAGIRRTLAKPAAALVQDHASSDQSASGAGAP